MVFKVALPDAPGLRSGAFELPAFRARALEANPKAPAGGMTRPLVRVSLVRGKNRETKDEAAVKELMKLKPPALTEERYKKFRKMGHFEKA